MTTVKAIDQEGVFKPVQPVDLSETRRVQLEGRPVSEVEVQAWLDQLRQTRARLQAEYGTFPDSTPDIAEDRIRDI